ncbi:hypothetical protein NVP1101O_057 [Vibrio phage 1.101.O._10N.261.45.C6]|nr:hypothetical protein NVP1101O_057 [Vibrio phage 1.101.O._10N.261.45.C6]
MRKLKKVTRRVKRLLGDRGEDWSPILLGAGLLFTLVFSSCSEAAEEVQCEFLSNLTPYQQDVAEMSYRAAEVHDLGHTAVAVAYKESKLGVYKVRYNRGSIKDVSVGVMHTVAYWKTKDMTPFEAGMWFQDMMEIDQKSVAIGVQDLITWQSRAKGNWKRGIEMYNAGYGKNPNYVKDVVKIYQQVKHCKF